MIEKGKTVVVMKPVDGKQSVQYEVGKVIYVGKRVLVEFFRNVCGHDGNGLGKRRHCWMCPYSAVREVVK